MASTVAGGALVLAAAGVARAETIVAVATGQADVRVAPADRQRESAIAEGVARARALAVPRALVNARTQGALIARASGLTLGAIQSVEQPDSSPFLFGAFTGRFGPNRYCGRVRSGRVVRRGGMRTVIRRERRQCSVPEFAAVTLSVTFGAAPLR